MMIWFFGFLQVVLIWIGWWVYRTYTTQPKHNHPSIFWNPVTRNILIFGPVMGMASLIILSFYLTDHPWLFLAFTIVWWLFSGGQRNPSKSHSTHIVMPVLTERGVEVQSFTTEELREEIRVHRQRIEAQNEQEDDGKS